MLGVKAVIDNIKSVLRLHSGSKKIYDKQVAEALGVSPTIFATSKSRNSHLYAEILNWCHETGVDADFIFFGTKVEV